MMKIINNTGCVVTVFNFGTNRATNMLAAFFAIRSEDVAAASLSVSLLLFIWGLYTLRIFIKISNYNKI